MGSDLCPMEIQVQKQAGQANFSDFEISADINELKRKGIGSFKQLVRIKANEYAFYTFFETRQSLLY
jgi:hypothetical protein